MSKQVGCLGVDETHGLRRMSAVLVSGLPPYFGENVIAYRRNLESFRSADGRFSLRAQSFVDPADKLPQAWVCRLASGCTRKQIHGRRK